MNDGPPPISVIVPSYNSSACIRQCLQSLLSQECKFPFEIILVDSSDDGTDQIVKDEFPSVRVLHLSERKFVGIARNIGVDHAKGDIILFLDTDCVAPSNWIDGMYRAFERTGADGVGGALKNGTPLSITGTASYYLEFFRFFPKRDSTNDIDPERTLFLIGANCGFRKEVFQTLRYYEPNYDNTKVGEDFYFCWLLAQQNKKLIFVPSISVVHLNKTGLLKLFRYQYKFGIGACYYRSHITEGLMSLFIKFSFLSLFLPFAIIPWIGTYVIRNLGVLEFTKYLFMLPLLYTGNCFWAIGFLKQAKNERKSKQKQFI